MTLRHDWRQAGTTGRAHLVARLTWPSGRTSLAKASACGVVRFAAWGPEGDATRCGLCRRLAEQARRRGQDLEVTP